MGLCFLLISWPGLASTASVSWRAPPLVSSARLVQASASNSAWGGGTRPNFLRTADSSAVVERAAPSASGRRVAATSTPDGVGPAAASSGASTGQGESHGRGRPRKRPRSGRPTGQRASDSLTKFVRGTDRARLLEHAEEILLCKRVQALRQLEGTRDALIATREEQQYADEAQLSAALADGATPPRAAVAVPSVESVDEPGAILVSEEEWACAVGLSVAELRAAIWEGRNAEEEIMSANTGLVRSALSTMKRTSGGRIDHGTTEQDLMQEGCLSLIKAADKFDVTLGLRFSTYATFWVRNALSNVVREQSRTIRLPHRVQNTYSQITRARAKLRAGSNWEPSDDEIGLALGVSADKVREVCGQVQSRAASLDMVVGEDRTLSDYIADSHQTAEVDLVQSMMRLDLGRLMELHLSAGERAVLGLRFGLEDGEPQTLRAVGEALDLPYSRVKNVLFAALTKLRKPHVASELKDYLDGDGEDEDLAL